MKEHQEDCIAQLVWEHPQYKLEIVAGKRLHLLLDCHHNPASDKVFWWMDG